MSKAPKKAKKPKQKLTPEQIKQKAAERAANLRKRQHVKHIVEAFSASGFNHIKEMSAVDFKFMNKKCDFDEVFILENIIVLVEHTANNESNVSTHLTNKEKIFGYINDNNYDFVEFAKKNFEHISKNMSSKYNSHDIQVKIVYCSLYHLKQSTKDHTKGIFFLDNPQLKYFLTLARTIKLSMRFELLDFLGVIPSKFGINALNSSGDVVRSFSGSVLPETQSHLPPDYKVVSFYISAGELIKRAFVLRRDGWRMGMSIYQRALQKKKVDAIRKHLISGKGAFLNNIIVALPESTKLIDNDGNQTNPKIIHKVEPTNVQITESFNSVAIIDGQHRIFSYYEGGVDEDKISKLRDQQNLLITGVMLPPGTTTGARDRFSAELFLQINSNQTNTDPGLIQDIGVMLHPFEANSLARRVLWRLNERGPFTNKFQSPLSESEAVKTATVVLYGLVPLIRPGTDDSLYKHWVDAQKENLLKGLTDNNVDDSIIETYVDFCTTEINKFVGAIKDSASTGRWTASRKVQNRLLTTTIVNGMLHCLRKISSENKISDNASYKASFHDIDAFNFQGYSSSHYNQLGLKLAEKFFNLP